MSESRRAEEVIEVEVERLPPDDEPARGARGAGRAGADAFRGRWGALLAGLLLDLADLLTPLGLGTKLGIPLGALVGWWAGGRLGLDVRRRLMLAAVAAAYCSLAGTSRLPLGTVVGALFGLRPAR